MSARSSARVRRPLGAALLGFEGVLALSSGYLLALLLAARDSIRNPVAQAAVTDEAPLRLAVLVPAHNEESGIEATLESLAACEYPASARRIVVIADNCTDSTAARCARAEVEVWERTDTSQRGKGFALIWALRRLFEEETSVDAIVMVDADCTVSPNLLTAIDRRLRSGASAVQVDYVAGNPEDSHVSALRFGAFALADTV
ncbi:MAG TPA: glycosyltransferase family 2 protein, partial [Solirubrobacterales bacterium]